MSDGQRTASLLEAVQLANTGVLVWNVVGPLLETALAAGESTISLDDLEAKSVEAGVELDALAEAISAARGRFRDPGGPG